LVRIVRAPSARLTLESNPFGELVALRLPRISFPSPFSSF
jgi:hypothetical protein